jgi:hypothetical protein
MLTESIMDSEDTGQQTQARKTQGEVILTSLRAGLKIVESRRRSIITVDDGEGTLYATVNSSATTFRQRGRGRRVTTRRQNLDLQESANQGQPLGHNNNLSGVNNTSEDKEMGSPRNTNRTTNRPTTMNYIEIKKLIKRRTLLYKKEKLTDEEIRTLVKEWHDHRADGELNQETMEREVRSMEESVAQYNVLEQLGRTPSERED